MPKNEQLPHAITKLTLYRVITITSQLGIKERCDSRKTLIEPSYAQRYIKIHLIPLMPENARDHTKG